MIDGSWMRCVERRCVGSIGLSLRSLDPAYSVLIDASSSLSASCACIFHNLLTPAIFAKSASKDDAIAQIII